MYQKIKTTVKKGKVVMIAIMAVLFVNSVNAQATRIAVLDFKAGVGVAQSDVDGISAILITYLNNNFTIVERTQIDRVINEQRFQRSSLTQQEMVRIGQILNVAKIVIGDVNLLGGQYNLDVRVIDVQTGVTEATAGETFQIGNIRPVTQRLAQTLSSKMVAIQRAAEQKRIAEQKAAEQRTAEERRIAEQKANGVLINGIIWATRNVGSKGAFAPYPEAYGNYYTWDEAQTACPVGWRLPTIQELNSLVNISSVWTIQNGTYGRRFGTGNSSVFLPAAGMRVDGQLHWQGTNGNYWSDKNSASPYNSDHMFWDESRMFIGGMNGYDDNSVSVRCVCETK